MVFWTVGTILDFVFVDTVKPLMSWQSRDSISIVLCHSVRFESPNKQGGATVEIESGDCPDMGGPTTHLRPMAYG